MWETYKDVASLFFKDALIAIDSFHVMRCVNTAMEKVRISIMQKYNNNADLLENNHEFYYMLKKFKYFFCKEFDEISNTRLFVKKLHRHMNKYDIRNYLFEIDPKLKLAYLLTAKYREFNKTSNYENAKIEFYEIVELFRDSNLKPFVECANTLVNWGSYIINSFITLPDGRRLSNGPCEGINATIEKIN